MLDARPSMLDAPSSILDPENSLAGLWTYLVLTFGLSSIFYVLIIRDGHLAAGHGLYVLGLMWCPGVSAILTCLVRRRSLKTLGWKWNNRAQLASYLIPLAYAAVAYGVVWITGLGGFPNDTALQKMAGRLGMAGQPWGLVLLADLAVSATLGMALSLVSALGEEIGWRGFLVPELAKRMSFTSTALVSGVIWTSWHVPILLFADYNSGTPAWYGLSCFAIMVIGISFVFAWMRLKYASLWTGAFLHASHNLFIQQVFTPLTTDTGMTRYIIDEFGAALAIVAVVVAVIVWRKRAEVGG